MTIIITALTVSSALAYIVLARFSLYLGRLRAETKDVSLTPEIKRLESKARFNGAMCCLFYTGTMIGHFNYPSWIQACIATLGLAAAGSYAVYFNIAKDRLR